MDYSWPTRGAPEDGVVAIDAQGRIDYLNGAAAALFGYDHGVLLGQALEVLIPRRQVQLHMQLRRAFDAGKVPLAIGRMRSVTGLRRDGTEIALQVMLKRDADAGRVFAFLHPLDRPGASRHESREPGEDALTGLPDRRALRFDLDALLTRVDPAQGRVCLLFVEIDPFAGNRAAFEPAHHDALIRACADRLEGLESDDVRLYRSGEDGFVFLMMQGAEPMVPGPQLARVMTLLRAPFEIGGHPLHLEFGIGHASAPEHGAHAGELIANAALALAASKVAFNRPTGYDESLRNRVEHRHRLLRDLRAAVERREFELYYQPQVDLVSGRIVALEALLRWRHPEWGLLLPGAFMEVLSSSELSLAVGDWVLREACAQVAIWNMSREAPLTVAVNVFPRQFDRDILPASITRALAESGLPPALLEIEITENIVIDPAAHSSEVFEALHALGVGLVLDDFGTGYASLTCLARHPVQKLKIDKSFVAGIDTGPGYRAILKSLQALARALGLGTVVEGVETEDIAALMREFGFEIGQGFLWSKPIPREDCARVLGLIGRVSCSERSV
ncbi:putative bifunctional diguanylate cyclase/phosphodiesterase [Rhodobacter capsulatus]|uniref:putative bifunctional diguanylate cyclase/phosphodiesterase n=1 Tax=Rhodobacter capsulatus TaxID=1061 RepID=UPI00402A0CA6